MPRHAELGAFIRFRRDHLQPGDVGIEGPAERNVARRVLLDPTARELYPAWDALAQEITDVLRHNTTQFPHDRELRALIDELLDGSDSFRRLWDRPEVFEKSSGHKTLEHPDVGRLELQYATFDVAGAPGQVLIVYTAEPGSPTAERLRRLARAAAPAQPRPGDQRAGRPEAARMQ